MLYEIVGKNKSTKKDKDYIQNEKNDKGKNPNDTNDFKKMLKFYDSFKC